MSSRCESVIERLGAYIDGELDAAERSVIDAHLATCEECRRAREALTAVDRALRRSIAEEPIDSAREEASLARTLERLREEPEPAWERPRSVRARRARWNLSWRWAVGMAAATAALLLALRIAPTPTAPEQRVARPIPSAQQEPIPAPPMDRAVKAPETEGGTRAEPAPTLAQDHLAEGAPPPQPPAASVPAEPAEPPGTEPEALDLTAETQEPRELEVRAADGDEASRFDEPQEPVVRSDEPPVEIEAPAGGSEWGRITSNYKAAPPRELDEKGLTLGVAPDDSDWYLTVAPTETTAVLSTRRSQLEAFSDFMERYTMEKTPREARPDLARSARALGDLWESIGRREASPSSFERATRLYRLAMELDRSAAQVDSVRLRRARAGGN